jgi:hypothetical protein
MFTQTPPGRATKHIVIPSPDTTFLSLLHGSPRSKQLYLVPVQGQHFEHLLVATTIAETVWLRWLLADFGISCDVATPLLCDNTNC